MATNWFIARVTPGMEELAELLIQMRGFQTYLPMQTVWRRPTKFHRNKIERRTALMVGYCFIGETARSDWWALLNCERVGGIVGSDGKWYRLRDDVVPGLRQRFGEVQYAPRVQQWMKTHREFKPGDMVTIVDGPFRSDLKPFKVEKIRGNAASILMHLFGAITEVKVPLDFLEAA